MTTRGNNLGGATIWECDYCDFFSYGKDFLLKHEKLMHPKGAE